MADGVNCGIHFFFNQEAKIFRFTQRFTEEKSVMRREKERWLTYAMITQPNDFINFQL